VTTHTNRTWFDGNGLDGVAVAAITDDLCIVISPLGIVTITGWEHTAVRLDFDDTVDVAAALTEAVRILRDAGHCTGYPDELVAR